MSRLRWMDANKSVNARLEKQQQARGWGWILITASLNCEEVKRQEKRLSAQTFKKSKKE
jgi:hypothetical protein